MTYLVRVELPWATFGFEVVDGRVGDWCAPIAAWMQGKDGRAMVDYWRRRGGVVTWEAWGC